jgi:hypothetical protein
MYIVSGMLGVEDDRRGRTLGRSGFLCDKSTPKAMPLNHRRITRVIGDTMLKKFIRGQNIMPVWMRLFSLLLGVMLIGDGMRRFLRPQEVKILYIHDLCLSWSDLSLHIWLFAPFMRKRGRISSGNKHMGKKENKNCVCVEGS